LEVIAHLTNLEDLLGLRAFLPPYRDVFLEDAHLFERYFKETEGFVSEYEFIENKKTRVPNMYTDMRRVYRGLTFLGVCLQAIPVILTIYYVI
jgi:hypothetical protein